MHTVPRFRFLAWQSSPMVFFLVSKQKVSNIISILDFLVWRENLWLVYIIMVNICCITLTWNLRLDCWYGLFFGLLGSLMFRIVFILAWILLVRTSLCLWRRSGIEWNLYQCIFLIATRLLIIYALPILWTSWAITSELICFFAIFDYLWYETDSSLLSFLDYLSKSKAVLVKSWKNTY